MTDEKETDQPSLDAGPPPSRPGRPIGSKTRPPPSHLRAPEPPARNPRLLEALSNGLVLLGDPTVTEVVIYVRRCGTVDDMTATMCASGGFMAAASISLAAKAAKALP